MFARPEFESKGWLLGGGENRLCDGKCALECGGDHVGLFSDVKRCCGCASGDILQCHSKCLCLGRGERSFYMTVEGGSLL